MGRNLKLAICLDDNGGMLFAGRRQSRDRVLIGELCDTAAGKIYITSFSSHIFKDHASRVTVCDNPFEEAPDGATVFIENLDIAPFEDRLTEIILYKWNEVYPADKWVDIDLSAYRVLAKKIFVGSSHGKITKLRLKPQD